ncbi:MAG: hypothetical protein J5854_05505 [Clostridia bacterium]|nr:hypothetical protein [Clostridia bacterium]
MRKIKLILTAVLCAALCAGCVDLKPTLDPSVTPEPTEEPVIVTPEPTEVPPTPAPTDPPRDITEEYDALGLVITGADHFIRYLTFVNITVYEENGDTFVDGMIENAYPEPITCSVDIVYTDSFGRELARARLQTRDGSFLLTLMPGSTVFFARIQTDMTLTDLDFRFVFDMETGIRPKPED